MWPWDRAKSEATIDDAQDQEQDGFDEQPEVDEDDETLSSLDDDTRGLLTKAADKAVGKEREALRMALQEQGLDIAPDGAVVFRDPKKVAERLSPLAAERPAAEPPAPAAVAADKPVDDEMPDPQYEKEAFLKWMDKRAERQVEERVRQVLERQAGLETQVYGREASYATERAKALLPDWGLAQLAENPEFDAEFRNALKDVDPRFWGDDENLVRIGASLITKLAPKQQAARDAAGRFTGSPQAAVKAAIHRSGLAQTGPAGDSARTGRAPVSDEERQAAQFLGCASIEEYRALDDPTGAAWRAERAKVAKASGRR